MVASSSAIHEAQSDRSRVGMKNSSCGGVDDSSRARMCVRVVEHAAVHAPAACSGAEGRAPTWWVAWPRLLGPLMNIIVCMHLMFSLPMHALSTSTVAVCVGRGGM